MTCQSASSSPCVPGRFALIGDQGGAIAELEESFEKVGVELEVARLGLGSFARVHTPDSEGADAELHLQVMGVSNGSNGSNM